MPERYVGYDLNEWDVYALETAVSFTEETDEEVEVVVAGSNFVSEAPRSCRT